MSKVMAVFGVGKAGLGEALGRIYGQNGYEIALIERDIDHLKQVVDALAAEQIKATAVPADLGDDQSIETAVQRINQLGDLDTVIFNATVRRKERPSAFTGEEAMADLNVNVGGAVRMVVNALPSLKANHGTILFTGSVVAAKPGTTDAAQAMGKAAMRDYALSLNKDLAKDHVFAGVVTIWTYIREGKTGAQDPNQIAKAYWDLGQARNEAEFLYKNR